MKKIYKIILVVGLIFSASACNDEFLERFPETEIGTENFFNTEEDLKIYLYNLYNFAGIGSYGRDAATDNQATTGNTELKTIMVSNASAATITSGWDWGDLRAINIFLANSSKAQISEELLNHYVGVGRFFRAKFYINKVKRFSDVPWYEEPIETGDEEALYKERDSREFVVGKIMEDLEFAAEYVQDGQATDEVDVWVVKSFLARFALYEGTYRKYHSELGLESTATEFLNTAATTAQDIMNNSDFSIYNTGNPATDYAELFVSTSLEDNPEVILGTYYESDVLNSGWGQWYFGNYESSPSKDLMQSYLMADGSYYANQDGYETKQFVEEFESRDARLSQTYAFPGWELINTGTYAQGGGVYIQQLQKNFSGYHMIKGYVNNTDQQVINSVDFPVIRYAEILLIYAESKAELGELSQADLDVSINQLRARAGMPDLMLNPEVDPVQQARYPSISNATLLEIRRERRIELALEGYRYDDIMRWGAGDNLEVEPEGLYFPGLGKYDLTGDGIEDIILIANSESIPSGEDREVNELGETLTYYRVGSQGDDASVYLENGESGTVQTVADRGEFVAPKYYYRPVPQTQVTLNPNLSQIFGW
ncbi:RagB/SusD family nutrient uptake outer membrane protein [Chondrinema litorale]|uniref:RagB/SusD family nutrient uptake outer membrane protein n=1 Tax=Chondrinema litorale TaxID=2994555 RepID=UPI00254386D2|nr:RagB/SusD family nutrient uptake outer membrane protein [Chondrinema litorale]UZR99308.1 RagB/SusD family nutrient uptake outer membrane protein [Chondrinema litorale]